MPKQFDDHMNILVQSLDALKGEHRVRVNQALCLNVVAVLNFVSPFVSQRVGQHHHLRGSKYSSPNDVIFLQT